MNRLDKNAFEEQYKVLVELYTEAKNQLSEVEKKLKIIRRQVQVLVDKAEVKNVLEKIMKGD